MNGFNFYKKKKLFYYIQIINLNSTFDLFTTSYDDDKIISNDQI